MQALYESNYERLIFQNWQWRFGDKLHLNDCEPLPSRLAAGYSMFNAGDLLLSCRWINAIFVVDRQTTRVKWASSLYQGQHDPDFLGDGLIRIFDNTWDGADGKRLGGSRLVEHSLVDGTMHVRYAGSEDNPFYTSEGGMSQQLSNGNILITESTRGRVFEINKSGSIVWEWVNERYDENRVAEVMEGTRYDISVETVSGWKEE